MTDNVSKEQVASARCADLYDFLIKYYDSKFKHEGESIRPKSNHSISIKKGYHGYKDFSSGETGNSIDFLVKHMGFDFINAVQALSDVPTITQTPAHHTDIQKDTIGDVPPKFPEPVDGMYKNLFAYLRNRGISTETIQMLISQKIMYQEKNRNNIIFIRVCLKIIHLSAICLKVNIILLKFHLLY